MFPCLSSFSRISSGDSFLYFPTKLTQRSTVLISWNNNTNTHFSHSYIESHIDFRKPSPICLLRTIFAGLPYASTLSGKHLVTNDPEPTTVFSPIVILSSTVTPNVMAEYRPIITLPPVIEPAEMLEYSHILESCSNCAPVAIKQKSSIMLSGLIIQPDIATTPIPMLTFLPIIVKG